MIELSALKAKLQTEAKTLGFADLAIADPSGIETAGHRLGLWLEAGRQGDMTWMADRAAWRADPRALWPEVRSILLLTESYRPEIDPLDLLARKDRAAISCYAWGKDYHEVIKKRLKRLGRWLIAEAGGEIKVFVDTAPVMEKPLAEAAGLGWQGKHTNLVSRELGSWFFLGAIFTTLDLTKDTPHGQSCGSCR
ncbi:MAG: tRNA epoxyqueuosine(34) reductase QueG, partial [Pseudomonadota bacterium]